MPGGGELVGWPRISKPKNIRCPYCVEDGYFKGMVAQGGGDWYLCSACGHLALPADPLFQCTCSKCVGLIQRSPKRHLQ
jgi:hypothetical protein